jgi:rSAM/selenodomain-associated transferase 1
MTVPVKNVLLVFVKNPQAGKVKTRLARTIGDEKALAIYRQLLSKTYDATVSVNCDRQVWYSSFIEKKDLWDAECFEKRLQNGTNLGERMRFAFKKAFDEGYDKAIIVGSDCAELTNDIIRQAFKMLDTHDIAIGPSEDGGYYLLAMNAFYGDLFADVEWSTPSVFDQTVHKIKEQGLSMYKLSMLNDIDTARDLHKSDIKFEKG